jgi:preprotein translocase subunit SecG
MILAEINWLNTSINLLLILFVFNCLLLSLLILMQRPKQEGLGAAFGSGMTDQVFGAQTTSVLQKGTVYLGVLFFVLTMTIAILYSKRSANDPTLVREPSEQAEESAGAADDEESAETPEPVTGGESEGPSLEDQYGGILDPEDSGDATTGEVDTGPGDAEEPPDPAEDTPDAGTDEESAVPEPETTESPEAEAGAETDAEAEAETDAEAEAETDAGGGVDAESDDAGAEDPAGAGESR